MKIKSLELHKIYIDKSRKKASGEIVLSNDWTVDVSVVENSEEQLFVACRRPKTIDNERFCEVVNKDVLKMIEEEVMNKYKEL